jgi:hypothetical protein
VREPEEYDYNSYKSCIHKKREDLVHRDLILGVVSKKRKDAQKGYEDFEEKAIDGELKNPLRKCPGIEVNTET